MGGDHLTLGHLSGRAQPVAFVAWQNVEMKMEDLNANDLDAASKIIAGSARAMGIEVTE